MFMTKNSLICKILFIYLLNLSSIKAQNVGIGQVNPASKLDIMGNLTVGQNYSGTSAPISGAIIEGNVGIGSNNPGTHRLQVSGGSILFEGDFVNQSVQGSVVSIGSTVVNDANATLVNVPATGSATAASNWLPGYSTGGNQTQSCAVCDMAYFQDLPMTIGLSEVINGSLVNITINDGSGPNNSGVVVIGNITVKTTVNANNSPIVRYAVWLQRSTDNFVTNAVNVYKVEDAIASGNSITSPNLGSGISTTTIVYPDLNLAPGTYQYRLVFQGLMGAGNGQTIKLQDRSMVVLQVKQ